MIEFSFLHPKMEYEHLGLLPFMLNEDDPRPARDQFHANYQHGGGWHPFQGFVLNADNSIKASDEPALFPLAQAHLRDELIVYYQYSWVAIIQPDRTFEICRMD